MGLNLVTTTTESSVFFSATGKAGSKAVKRPNRRGFPVYTAAKFPKVAAEKLARVTIPTKSVLGNAFTTLAS